MAIIVRHRELEGTMELNGVTCVCVQLKSGWSLSYITSQLHLAPFLADEIPLSSCYCVSLMHMPVNTPALHYLSMLFWWTIYTAVY